MGRLNPIDQKNKINPTDSRQMQSKCGYEN